jgi:hypothetical protein
MGTEVRKLHQFAGDALRQDRRGRDGPDPRSW